FLLGHFALELSHRAVEHLRVEFESNSFDMSALLTTQQISRPAQFEIKSSNFETGTQIGEFLQRGQTTACDGRQLNLGWEQEISVSTAIRAAHAATQLVQLGESQALGAIDQNGVAKRDIQTVFDYRRCNQNVGFVMHELEHRFLEFGFWHLAVPDQNACPGDQLL